MAQEYGTPPGDSSHTSAGGNSDRLPASLVLSAVARHSALRNQSMIVTDDMIGTATFAAGCRTLALDGVHRRYRSEPIDALAEPKSASVRFIGCVHFAFKAKLKAVHNEDRPLRCGTIAAATHFRRKLASLSVTSMRAECKNFDIRSGRNRDPGRWVKVRCASMQGSGEK